MFEYRIIINNTNSSELTNKHIHQDNNSNSIVIENIKNIQTKEDILNKYNVNRGLIFKNIVESSIVFQDRVINKLNNTEYDSSIASETVRFIDK